MNDMQSQKETLVARLTSLRSQLAELRSQIRGFAHLPEGGGDAEGALDCAQQSLESQQPDLVCARSKLAKARDTLDKADQALTLRNAYWEWALAVWGGVTLLLSFCWMVKLWSQTGGAGDGVATYTIIEGARLWDFTLGGFTVQLDAAQWHVLRPVLLAAAGGLAGAGLAIGRLLYLTIPSRTLNPKSILWYLSSPIYAAGLASAMFAVIRAGLLGAVGQLHSQSSGSTLSAIALGLLVGFEPTAVFERIKAVVRAFFGTDEVKAPRLSSPQVSLQAGTLTIRSAVTASPATRIVSVSATLQTDGFKTSVSLDRGADHIWSVSCPVPQALLKAPHFTATIEARDEAGNLSRSEAISVSMSAPSPPVQSVLQPVVVVSSTPSEGGTLGAADPVVLNFSSALRDLEVTLTAADGSEIELAKAWDDAQTSLTLSHAALPAGDYRLLMVNAVLPDGADFELGRELRFKV